MRKLGVFSGQNKTHFPPQWQGSHYLRCGFGDDFSVVYIREATGVLSYFHKRPVSAFVEAKSSEYKAGKFCQQMQN